MGVGDSGHARGWLRSVEADRGWLGSVEADRGWLGSVEVDRGWLGSVGADIRPTQRKLAFSRFIRYVDLPLAAITTCHISFLVAFSITIACSLKGYLVGHFTD